MTTDVKTHYDTIMADIVSGHLESGNQSAICGRINVPGIGRVIVFDSVESREAYEAHVGVLSNKGEFTEVDSLGIPTYVAWGQA